MRLGSVLLIVLLLCAAPAAAEMRIFDLQHRRAADIAEVVQAALGDEARVTAIDHSLVVDAAPAQLAAANDLIRQLDRPARMVRVYVAQDQRDSSRGNSAGGSIYVTSGDAAVSVGGRPAQRVPQPDGATVIVDGDHGRVVAGGKAGHRVETRRAEQFLVTLEGSPARISVGQRLPFAESWLVLARRHAHIVENIRYESVDTGFEVTPAVFAGGEAELEIHPFMAFVDSRGSRDIRFTDLSATIRVPLNKWFDLGGTMAVRDEVSRQILGGIDESGTASGSVRVRVELQPN